MKYEVKVKGKSFLLTDKELEDLEFDLHCINMEKWRNELRREENGKSNDKGL